MRLRRVRGAWLRCFSISLATLSVTATGALPGRATAADNASATPAAVSSLYPHWPAMGAHNGKVGPPTPLMRSTLLVPANDSISCDYNDNIGSFGNGDLWGLAPNYLITVVTMTFNEAPGALQNFAICLDFTRNAWAFWSSNDHYWVTDEIGYAGAQKYQFYAPSPTVGADQLFNIYCEGPISGYNSWSIQSTVNGLYANRGSDNTIRANAGYQSGNRNFVWVSFNTNAYSPSSIC